MAALRRIGAAWVGILLLCVAATSAFAQSRNLAPGFKGLPPDARVTIAPVDVELFEISAGGVLTPKADWTASAHKHMSTVLQRRASSLGPGSTFMAEKVADDHAELLQLYGAVGRAISIHHFGAVKLPTKEERLDWSVGDALRPLREATSARYGLFTWMRDSYASAERKAMMVGLALLGIGVVGGVQAGYASLIDLETGQVLWFNQSVSTTGDLRDEQNAEQTMARLLEGLPTPAPR